MSNMSLLLRAAFCLMWMNRILGTVSPAALSIQRCEILEYSSITCYWETRNHKLDNSSYRLQVNKTACDSKDHFILLGVCDSSHSHCSVQPIDSALHCFCADVHVSTGTRPIRSPHFCFNGVNEVKLHPPVIIDVVPSMGRSVCLQVTWGMPDSLPDSEKSFRQLQIEYTTNNQTQAQTIPAYSRKRMEKCELYPGSRYTVRLRAQDTRAPSHWSAWASRDAMTLEKAPSAAPRLWRHIQHVKETGRRNITLLWKPLSWPEANGIVLSYTVSCHSELNSSCGVLNASKTSCNLGVSANPCHCVLTATNSAGTSPSAHIYIPGHADPELPPPFNVHVTPLDDTQMKVEWTHALNHSETGFVVQWKSVPNIEAASLHWEHLAESAQSFIITGLQPLIPYNVTVVSVYGAAAGSDASVIAFTREGAPSVGPKLSLLEISSSSIVLRWDPVPMDKLHGFIRNYSILYSINGKDKSKTVEGNVEQTSLNGLIQGTYNICVMAHTVAGGATGPWQMVAVGHADLQIIPILLCALLLSLLILIIPVCLRVKIKQCLCPVIPDPSESSVSAWNTKLHQNKLTSSSTVSSFVSIDQTSCYHGYNEKDYSPVQVLSYNSVQDRNDNNEVQPNIFNFTSAKLYMDLRQPVFQQRNEELTKPFPIGLINQSYFKPDQIRSANVSVGYQEDHKSSSDDLSFDADFNYRCNKMAQRDLHGYIHVSQSYMPVITTVETYRTLNFDERSHFLKALPEDT